MNNSVTSIGKISLIVIEGGGAGVGGGEARGGCGERGRAGWLVGVVGGAGLGGGRHRGKLGKVRKSRKNRTK